MIVKRTNRADDGHGFRRLARYIARVGVPDAAPSVRFSNFHETETLDEAIFIAESFQGAHCANSPFGVKRSSASNKTYHLIVSFHPDDQLNEEMLAVIEDRLCASIGYAEHQRLSALHTDTEHPHLHVAINKVHPETGRLVTPFRDFVKLSREAALLEKEFGLTVIDRSKNREEPRNYNAEDFEAQTGLESFSTWLNTNLRPEVPAILQRVNSWSELHNELKGWQVVLQRRGRGLIVRSLKEDVFVKASGVHRQLSLASLEAIFGKYKVPVVSTDQPGRGGYSRQPIVGDNPLWATYQESRQVALYMQEQTKKTRLELIVLEKKIARGTIDALKASSVISGRLKRSEYEALWQRRQDRWERLRQKVARDKEHIRENYKLKSWRDWLLDEAVKGNSQAENHLRRQKERQYVLKKTPAIVALEQQVIEGARLSRFGVWMYESQGGRAVDCEGVLRPRSNNESDILTCLHIASVRTIKPLKLVGSATVVGKIIDVAAIAGLDVRFESDAHEKRRRILSDIILKEPHLAPDHVKNEIDKWIAERNITRRRVLDLPEHKRWPVGQSVEGIYKGIRKIGGSQVALVLCQDKIQVVQVDAQQAAECRRNKVGSVISVTGFTGRQSGYAGLEQERGL